MVHNSGVIVVYVDVQRSSNISISVLFKLTCTTKYLSLFNINSHQNNDNQMFRAQWENAFLLGKGIYKYGHIDDSHQNNDNQMFGSQWEVAFLLGKRIYKYAHNCRL